MDKFDPDLANLQNTQVDHSDVTSVHLLSEQEDSKEAEAGSRGSDPRAFRPRSREQADCSRVRGLPQLGAPLSRWSRGRFSRTSRRASSRRRHAS